MIGDLFNKVSGSGYNSGTGLFTAAPQTLVGITATAPLVSTDSIDLLAAKDIGAGRDMAMVFATPTGILPPSGPLVAVTFTNANDLVGLTAHGLPIGTPVFFSTMSGGNGLTANTVYYVTISANTTANAFCLATSLANALAGVITTPVAITADTTGFMTVLSTLEFQVIAADDSALTKGILVLGSSGPIAYRPVRTVTFDGTTDEECDLVAHGFPVGTPVTFAGGTPPVEVVLGAVYYTLEGTTANSFKLAATKGGTAFTLTGNGSGTTTVQQVDGMLTANGQLITVGLNQNYSDIGRRYLGARYVANSTLSAGTVNAALVPSAPQEVQHNYPSGFSV